MIPGMGQLARDEELVSEKDLKRIEAIIFSMTKQERRNPDIIKGRRKERIAKGSGTQIQEVTGLVSQFKQMQRMMKKMGGGKGMDPRDLMRRMR
jgi:signal recognition particle subunit SRP54